MSRKINYENLLRNFMTVDIFWHFAEKMPPQGFELATFKLEFIWRWLLKENLVIVGCTMNLNLWFTNEPLQAFRTHFLSAPFVAASISLDLKSYFKVWKTKLFDWSRSRDWDFDETIFNWASRWTPTWRCWSRTTRNNCRQQRATWVKFSCPSSHFNYRLLFIQIFSLD